MIRICSTYLNVRVGSPATSAPSFIFLTPGEAVDVSETVPGTMLEGNNRWYKGTGDFYYWSGGFEGAQSHSFRIIATANPAQQLLNYNALMDGLDKKLLANLGGETSIAILDTGYSFEHPDLKKVTVTDSKNFIAQNENIEDDSIHGHGSHILGLMGGSATGIKGIGGLAPAAKYQIYKVMPSSEDASVDTLMQAWQHMQASCLPHIVNMSLSISGLEYLSVKPFLETFTTQTICVVAAGNNEDLLADKKGMYALAKHPNVLSVGSVSKEFFLNNPAPVFHPRLDFIVPLVDLWSCSNEKENAYKKLGGCSMGTAIVTGIASLLLSAQPPLKANPTAMRSALKEVALSYSSYLFSTFNLLKP